VNSLLVRYNNALINALLLDQEGHFVCLVDKKAFVAKHCKMITEFLDNDLHIPWAHKVSDIKKQWESISMMKVLK